LGKRSGDFEEQATRPTIAFQQGGLKLLAVGDGPIALHALPTEGTCIVGRSSAAHIQIDEPSMSRLHAALHIVKDSVNVEDLGSTNGTWVNGSEISAPTPLTGGDRIEFGPNEITFCEIEPVGEPADPISEAARTAITQPGAARGQAFTGDLSQIPPFAVLQVLEMGSQTGRLELSTPEGTCRIWFSAGAPIHADSEKLCGFDAALAVVAAEQGSFRFEPQVVTEEATIQCSVTELLLESCRLADEENA
jgi:pSer/pThr/pTyr-binding forkhead associated (FHA) protein